MIISTQSCLKNKNKSKEYFNLQKKVILQNEVLRVLYGSYFQHIRGYY